QKYQLEEDRDSDGMGDNDDYGGYSDEEESCSDDEEESSDEAGHMEWGDDTEEDEGRAGEDD
ncbi:hypothetical protein FRC10_007796, partial [Ceratobasidium sp. 414]